MIATQASAPKQRLQAMLDHASGDKRFKILEVHMKRHQFRHDALIEVLHKAQELFGYLEDDLLLFVSYKLKLPPSRVYGVATFYHFFNLKPQGEHTCVVCMGTACYVKGADKVIAAVQEQTGIKPGETTADNKVSLLTARCIGACGICWLIGLNFEKSGRSSGSPPKRTNTIPVFSFCVRRRIADEMACSPAKTRVSPSAAGAPRPSVG